MKTFQLELSQEMKGYYKGILEIEAKTRTEALEKLAKMSNTEIDDQTEWEHSDEYCGELETIQLLKIKEI
jgi:hypothetical protein